MTKVNIAQAIEEWRRRVIIHLLHQALGAKASDSIIQVALDRVGLTASRDDIRTSLSWLGEQGLVDLEELDRFTIATLTRRGRDVAGGQVRVPGVADRHD